MVLVDNKRVPTGKRGTSRRVAAACAVALALMVAAMWTHLHRSEWGGYAALPDIPPVAGEVEKDPETSGGCCLECSLPTDECCLPCSSVSPPREHDLVMALAESISAHIQDKHAGQYPFLANRAWEGNSHIGNRPPQATFYYDLVRSIFTPEETEAAAPAALMCEIGINGGHSAAIFLAATARTVRLTGFDLGEFKYTPSVKAHIDALYPGRFDLILGNSKRTVPEWVAKHGRRCDFFSIDGDHSRKGVKRDIENAVAATKAGGTVIFDDMNPGSETRAGLDECVTAGLLVNLRCVENVPTPTSYRDRYDETHQRKMISSWCWAKVP